MNPYALHVKEKTMKQSSLSPFILSPFIHFLYFVYCQRKIRCVK